MLPTTSTLAFQTQEQFTLTPMAVLGHLSGMSRLAAQVEHDFATKILCDNVNPLTINAAKEALDADTRAHYSINRGETFSRLKRALGRWLLPGRDALDNTASVFGQPGQLIKNLVCMRPGRSFPEEYTERPLSSHACTKSADLVLIR